MKKQCYMKLRTYFKGLRNPIAYKIISKLQPFIPLFAFGLTEKHGGKVEICIKVRCAYLLCLQSKKPEPYAWAWQVVVSNIKSDCQISQRMPANSFMTVKFSKLFIFVGLKYFPFFFSLKAATCITLTMTNSDQILVSFGVTLRLNKAPAATKSCRLKPALCFQDTFYLSSLL